MNVPTSITQKQIVEALAILGLDANEVKSLSMHEGEAEICVELRWLGTTEVTD